MASNKKMVTLKKGTTEHDFVPESVGVWVEKGWKVVDDKDVKESPAAKTAVKEAHEAAKQQNKES